MYGILFIIIGALLAFLNGDDSGIIAILKIVGGGMLILGVMWGMAFHPWITILTFIGIIVFAILWSSNTNHLDTNSGPIDNIKNTDNNEYSQPIINTNLTGFKAELQENTKTPSQVADDEWKKEQDDIISCAKYDYVKIKNKLLDKAKSGQYTIKNNQRQITVRIENTYLLSCIDRDVSFNRTGKYGTSSYRDNAKAIYTLRKVKQFNIYMTSIKKLAFQDNIEITPLFIEREPKYGKENRINLPYTYRDDFSVMGHTIKVYIEGFIAY